MYLLISTKKPLANISKGERIKKISLLNFYYCELLHPIFLKFFIPFFMWLLRKFYYLSLLFITDCNHG